MTLSDGDTRSQNMTQRRVRSSNEFYRDMLTFKVKRENKLELMRNQKIVEEREERTKRQRVCSADESFPVNT